MNGEAGQPGRAGDPSMLHHAMWQASPAALLLVDEAAKIVAMNAAARRLFGRDADSGVGTLGDLVSDGEVPALPSLLSAREPGSTFMASVVSPVGGARVPVELTSSPMI